MREELIKKIRTVGPQTFEATALEVFRYQAAQNALYRKFLNLVGINPTSISQLQDIPAFPIRFFKSHRIQTGEWSPQIEFSSSGTTGETTSRHLVRDLDWYRETARRGFEERYGTLQQYCVLALLPAYLERSGSSLVFMADDFIRASGHPRSGFYLYNYDALADAISTCQAENTAVLLLGVSFALWDFAEQYPMPLHGVTVMETGGMKGRRRELTREELHEILTTAFRLQSIHSEYGMTELLSQGYSPGQGLFYPTPTLRVWTRDITDPLSAQAPGKTGVLNIADLANLDSISFIATDDLGKVYEDGSFEVLGRLDAGDLRGCNLLVA